MKRIFPLIGAASAWIFLFALAPELHAALVVDWGGTDYVTSTRPFSNPTPDNGKLATQYGGFSDGNPLLLNPSSGYAGPSGAFYGEVVRISGSGTFTNENGNVPNASVSNNSAGDRLDFRLDGSTLAGLFLWRQGDFLNGFDTGTVNLGSGSTIGLDLATNVGTTGGRAVLRVNGDYYISEVIVPSGGLGLFTKNLTALSWFTYDPASAINTIGSSYDLALGGIISNVTEVGFYFDITGISNDIRIDSVEFNAVPEPATLGLFVLGLGALTLFRRTRIS